MTQDEPAKIAAIPTPGAFRAWVAAALVDLRLSASRVATDLSFSKNVLSEFMRDPARDLKLGTAARIAAHLQAEADRRGVVLTPLERGVIDE